MAMLSIVPPTMSRTANLIAERAWLKFIGTVPFSLSVLSQRLVANMRSGCDSASLPSVPDGALKLNVVLLSFTTKFVTERTGVTSTGSVTETVPVTEPSPAAEPVEAPDTGANTKNLNLFPIGGQ